MNEGGLASISPLSPGKPRKSLQESRDEYKRSKSRQQSYDPTPGSCSEPEVPHRWTPKRNAFDSESVSPTNTRHKHIPVGKPRTSSASRSFSSPDIGHPLPLGSHNHPRQNTPPPARTTRSCSPGRTLGSGYTRSCTPTSHTSKDEKQLPTLEQRHSLGSRYSSKRVPRYPSKRGSSASSVAGQNTRGSSGSAVRRSVSSSPALHSNNNHTDLDHREMDADRMKEIKKLHEQIEQLWEKLNNSTTEKKQLRTDLHNFAEENRRVRLELRTSLQQLATRETELEQSQEQQRMLQQYYVETSPVGNLSMEEDLLEKEEQCRVLQEEVEILQQKLFVHTHNNNTSSSTTSGTSHIQLHTKKGCVVSQATQTDKCLINELSVDDSIHCNNQKDKLASCHGDRGAMDDLIMELKQRDRDIATLQDELRKCQNSITQKDQTIEQLDSIIRKGEEVRRQLHSTVDSLSRTIQGRNKTIEVQQARLMHVESVRRETHNRMLELRGNIRVYCRVRPSLSHETNSEQRITFPDASVEGKSLAVLSDKIVSSNNNNKVEMGKKYFFTFDRVFPPTTSQESVFEDIAHMVQSALDGYNVCVFAYGQTGSGKTYTMEGVLGSNERGIIPRAVEQITTAAQSNMNGWTYGLSAQFVEIYNEKLRDLLNPSSNFVDNNNTNEANGTSNTDQHQQRHGKDAAPKLQIKHDSNGNTYITNVTRVPFTEESDVQSLLETAQRNRSVAETKCNAQSSRSHSVFSLYIDAVSPSGEQLSHGILNIIDLAGSERLDVSDGASSERMKEVQFINKSLSCLGDVIVALASKTTTHVPYRNSKLTYLLQNCLGAGSKVLMFVNISPLSTHIGESLCSLRFARKVNSCEVGLARRCIEHVT